MNFDKLEPFIHGTQECFFQENLVHQFDYAGISTLLYPAGSRVAASI
jgi:hypothetical protein